MRMENDDHWIKLVDIRKRKDCKAYDRAIEALLRCCEKEEEFIGHCNRGKCIDWLTRRSKWQYDLHERGSEANHLGTIG